jgi:hypothetical protein
VQTEPRTGARRPEQSDAPLGGRQISNAVDDLSPHVAPWYATTAARDAAHANFVTNGGVLRDGMLARVSGVGLMYYSVAAAAWLTVASTANIAALEFPRLLGETHGTGQFDRSPATTEAKVGGGVNEIGTITNLSLKSGRAYRAEFRGRAWAGVAGVTVTLRIRVGASVSASSVAVATRQTVQPAVGPGGINDTHFDGTFVVQTTGTYQAAVYGVVASGALAVGPDARGRYELIISDVGPSVAGLNTVTS